MTTSATTRFTTCKPPPSKTNTPLLDALNKDGYCVLRNALTPQHLETLRTKATTLANLARTGKWPYLRTLPKPFPPWPSDPSHGIWGVQHLLHPDCPGRFDFANLYFSDSLLNPTKELLGLSKDDETADDHLVMELLNLLVTPDRDFELRWHRDAVSTSPTTTRASEAEQLGLFADASAQTGYSKRKPFHAQYNIPLYDDRSLQVVPASHLRPRTDDESRLLAEDEFTSDLPGLIEVELRAGDVVFYDNNILHRGVYRADVQRLTLHGSVGDVRGGDGRARNVLQHGVGEWISRHEARFEGLSGGICERAEGMRRRLIELGGRVGADGQKAVFGEE